jgi:hypothetical protein
MVQTSHEPATNDVAGSMNNSDLKIGHSHFRAGGDIHVRFDSATSPRPGTSQTGRAPSQIVTNDMCRDHFGCLGSWHVKQQFTRSRGVFKAGNAREYVKRTVNFVIEKERQKDLLDPGSKNGMAGLQAAYGMQVNVNNTLKKVAGFHLHMISY